MNTSMIKTIAFAVGVLFTAALLGLLAGELAAPDTGKKIQIEVASRQPEKTSSPEFVLDRNAPPIFFLAGTPNDGDWSLVKEEIALAKAQGVRQYILPVRLPWNGETPDLSLLEAALEIEPNAAFILALNYNPPERWLQSNIAAARSENGKALVFPSLASPLWRQASVEISRTLYTALEEAGIADHVLGVTLGALRGNRWRHPDGIDENPANLKAFRDWLRSRYSKPEVLQAAWGNEIIDFDTAFLPKSQDNEETTVFANLPKDQPRADFTAFTAWQTADAIEKYASFWKTVAGPQWQVYVRYGHGLELTENTAGHSAFYSLLDGALDGFMGTLSSSDRGLGGVGALPGPVNSALYHGKKWILIDDARTGLSKDPATGRPTRLIGLNRRDVFNVQYRNFALALTQGLGIAWADPLGAGALCDSTQWKELGAMYQAYQTAQNSDSAPDLLVVYDEAARNYVMDDKRAHECLLQETRDAVFRLGVNTHFCLLGDFLDGTAPQASAYLFLNLFHLDTKRRESIHARLAQEQAAAIWHYAPGYFGDKVSGKKAISETVAMEVQFSDAGAMTGSKYAIDGTWLAKEDSIGYQEIWTPRISINDDNADVLANYVDGGEPSIALRQLDSGWTSIYIAEPGISPELLREIFHILELPLYPVPSEPPRLDAIYVGRGYLAIHASEPGTRSIQLPATSDARDVFKASAGWLNTDYFSLPMNMGETRILSVRPITP